MQDLKDAAFVIKLTANKLYGFRNDRGGASNEIDTFILENEVSIDDWLWVRWETFGDSCFWVVMTRTGAALGASKGLRQQIQIWHFRFDFVFLFRPS